MILVCLVWNTNIETLFVRRVGLDDSCFPRFSGTEIPVLQEITAQVKTKLVFHPHLIQFCLCQKCYFTGITKYGKWALSSTAELIYVLIGQIVVTGFHSWVELFLQEIFYLNAHANRITEFPFWLIFFHFCGKILFSQAVFLGWKMGPYINQKKVHLFSPKVRLCPVSDLSS